MMDKLAHAAWRQPDAMLLDLDLLRHADKHLASSPAKRDHQGLKGQGRSCGAFIACDGSGMNRAAQALAALAGFLALAGAASAQQADQAAAPPPDKSGFTLFNPTPEADLRSFCADRPTKSTGPCTVDAGHLQFESDIANVTWATAGGVGTTSVLYTNPTLKLGVTNT